jgi:hypothetical protein
VHRGIHACIHTYTYIHACIHTYTYIHTYIHTCMNSIPSNAAHNFVQLARTYVRTYIHTYMNDITYLLYKAKYFAQHTIHTHMYICTHKHTQIHIHTDTYTHDGRKWLRHTHTYTHTHIHTCTYSQIPIHRYIHIHTGWLKMTTSYTHTYTHTHTYPHTHRMVESDCVAASHVHASLAKRPAAIRSMHHVADGERDATPQLTCSASGNMHVRNKWILYTYIHVTHGDSDVTFCKPRAPPQVTCMQENKCILCFL